MASGLDIVASGGPTRNRMLKQNKTINSSQRVLSNFHKIVWKRVTENKQK